MRARFVVDFFLDTVTGMLLKQSLKRRVVVTISELAILKRFRILKWRWSTSLHVFGNDSRMLCARTTENAPGIVILQTQPNWLLWIFQRRMWKPSTALSMRRNASQQIRKKCKLPPIVQCTASPANPSQSVYLHVFRPTATVHVVGFGYSSVRLIVPPICNLQMTQKITQLILEITLKKKTTVNTLFTPLVMESD